MKSLSIVSTQMQLVNCVEALYTMQCTDNVLIILAANTQRKSQIESLISHMNYCDIFTTIHVIAPKSKFNHANIFQVKLKLRKISKGQLFDLAVLGNYKLTQQRYLLYNLGKANPQLQTIIIDDGMATVDIVERRQIELQTGKASLAMGSKSEKFLYRIGLIARSIPRNVSFFTNYETLVLNACDNIILNEYTNLKERLNISMNIVNDDTPATYILGQPLPQIAIIDKKNYCKYIECYLNNNLGENKKVIYVPHPAEEVEQTLSKELFTRLEIKRYDIPFEIVSLWLPERTHLVGFYTSALVNIHDLRKDIFVTSIVINDADVLSNIQILKNAYLFLKEKGVNCLKY